MSGRRPLQTAFKAYSVQGNPALITPAQGKQLVVHTASIENRSGGATNAGILRRYGDSQWNFGKLVALDTPDFTDGTESIQANVAFDAFEAINDGFLAQGREPFGLLGLELSVGAGAGGVYTIEYFNGAAYVTLGSLFLTPDYTATGSILLVFPPPVDWAAGTTAAVGGMPGMYSIKVSATTAPASAATFDEAWIGEFLAFKSALPDDGVLSLDYPDDTPLVLDAQEGVMPYFETAHADNLMTVVYGVNG